MYFTNPLQVNDRDSIINRINTFNQNSKLNVLQIDFLHKYFHKLKYLNYFDHKLTLIRNSYKNIIETPRQLIDIDNYNNKSLYKTQFIKNLENNILHLATDDHEWSISQRKSHGKPYLTISEAEIQLIKKGYLINKISRDYGVPWTHLIDAGALNFLEEASNIFPHSWGEVYLNFCQFLTDTKKEGNDLGLHLHPEKSSLAIDKIESDKIWIKNQIPLFGEITRNQLLYNSNTQKKLLSNGIKTIELHARKVDSSFSVRFFRAGKYSTGRNFYESAETMNALSQSGISISSDSLEFDYLNESLGRDANQTVFFSKVGFPWKIEEDKSKCNFIQALPLRTKVFPYYSILAYSHLYSHNKNVLKKLIKSAWEGNRIIISIDHDIDFGAQSKGGWRNLNENTGDWLCLRNYLDALHKQKCIKFINTQEFHHFIQEYKNLLSSTI